MVKWLIVSVLRRLQALQRLESSKDKPQDAAASAPETAPPIGLYTVFKDNLDPTLAKAEPAAN